MKKFNSLKTSLTLVLIAGALQSAIAQDQVTLALWNFNGWLGGSTGVPAGQSMYDVIYPDDGTQKTTAKLGTDQMFDPAYNPTTAPVVRKWSAPSKPGYVRCTTGWLTTDGTERFYQMSFSTTGLFNLTLNSSHATSGTSSSYQHSFTVQYRIGDGPWTNLAPKKTFDVTEVSETTITFEQVKELPLPADAAGKVGVDVRYLFGAPTFVTDNPDPAVLTGWQTAWNTGTQIRLDNLSVKGYQVATTPTIFNSYGDIDFGQVLIGQSKTITVKILASKVSGSLTPTTSAPFSLNKTTIAGTFNEFNTTLDITFNSATEGVFEKDFVLSGTGVTKTVKLRAAAVLTSIDQQRTTLDNVIGSNGVVTIHAAETQLVTITDLSGRTVVKQQVQRGITNIPLKQGQLYIVNIGNNHKKIVL
ncbi:MAG TPA: hypothetical protein VFP20_00150 [Bacteroidales bacterium]|nr:hypothetical protein [Bacteroidales bacterium]